MTFWQYSDAGEVDGIRTQVDMNKYYGSDQQLKQLAGRMSDSSAAGNAANQMKPAREQAGREAEVANQIEHTTGVNVPLPSDFLMTLLGVIGGRRPAEALMTQGSTELAGVENNGMGGSVDRASDAAAAAGVSKDRVAASKQLLQALTALANALNETTQNGKRLPVEQIVALLGQNGNKVNVEQILQLLKGFAGTQDWAAKLERGEVAADPQAMQKLSDAASAARQQNPTAGPQAGNGAANAAGQGANQGAGQGAQSGQTGAQGQAPQGAAQ